MLIQYISDIHLEFYNLSKIIKLIPSAPILCLAGDIGNPLLENYEIFLILRNQILILIYSFFFIV